MIRHPEPSAAPSAQRSVSRAIITFIAAIVALTGVFTLPPAPARAASSDWNGQVGSIVPGEGETAAGTFLAAGSSANNDAQFTYDVPVIGNNGESGTWSFSTIAGANETLAVPYRWTGLHAWFNVTARLDAVVVRGATLVSTTNLVNAGPQSCCTTPSNGFDYAGTASFTVQTGDRYGFVLRGSNGDSNDLLRGELTIGTVVPTSCANAQGLYGAFVGPDGRYVIHPAGGQRFTVHCADMAIPAGGKDYLEVRSGPGVNFGQYAAGATTGGTTVTTSFTKIRLNPATLTMDIGDTRFATSSGSLNHPDSGLGNPLVTSMPYATAMGCEGAVANGTANVNLQGTPFAVDDTFGIDDLGVGGATFSALDQVVDLTGGGFCGWTAPEPLPFNPFNPTAGQAAYQILNLRYVNETPPTVSTPVLFNSIARAGSTADLYALVEGAETISVTVQVRTSDSCTNGVLDSPAVVATSTEPTDADGYVLFDAVPGIDSGDFVTITVTSPASAITPAPSECVRTTGDNDAWPKALPLTFASPAIAEDVIEVDGRARWYRFPIFPNQRITVSLSDLAADYDLAVFRDIGAEFASQLEPKTADDLKRLSAKFSPSVFSPSVFSPSVFSPSVFSPDAYAPSVFSPSVFSPSVFSPSVFSPSVFSPSVFSPSVFSPSVFSPSVFSPSVFSPSVFSPSVFSPSVFSALDVQKAFSSAQSTSLIGVSATSGNGNETVVVNSWNETGEFYVRVAGRGGAFDPSNVFTLTVTASGSECTELDDTMLTPRSASAEAGDFTTVIVTDSSRLVLGDGSEGTLADRIEDLRIETDGIVIDLADEDYGDLHALRVQADAEENRGCPFAQNLVAEEIKGIVDSYRATAADPDAPETLRYVTILGNDTVVPFFRYPDQSLLGQESGYFPPVESDSISEASLRRDYILSQDAYGAGETVDIRTTAFPIPDLAVGRLVETPDEIVGMIDAYFATNGVIIPDSSLVTGYDFLTDAADAVSGEFDAGTTVDELITDAIVSPQQLQQPGMTDPRTWSWDADDLRDFLLGDDRHDLVFLAGHFSANSALAADYQTQVVTTELTDSDVDLVNSIVISAGCHAGYNLIDDDALAGVALPLDWAQAFAQKQAVLVAGTGYQYGDTDFLEYSERLYRDFANELRAGTAGTPVSIGEALAAAKRTYIAGTQDIRGIHEKAVLEATLFGLPMFGVDMQAGRTGPSGGGTASIEPMPVGSGPAAELGLATEDISVDSPLTSPPPRVLDVVGPTGITGTVNATWLEGLDGVVTNPAEPALPKEIVDVTAESDDLVLRGVGFRGGTYTDTPNVLPLTGAPTTELRGVHVPFVSPVFYPMRMWTANYFGELDSGGTNLIVTPVQHRSDPANALRSIRRVFSDLDLRLFYVDAPTLLGASGGGPNAGASLADAPTIVDVDAAADGSDIVFSAQVLGDPSAAIHEVWVVWTDGGGEWFPLDLQQCTAPLPASCAGLDDSRVWTGRLADAPDSIQYVAQAANGTGLVSFDDNRGQYYLGSTTPAPAAAATSLTLVSPVPVSGTFGQTVSVTAQLKAGAAAVAGKPVFIQVGGAAAIGLTGGDGKVTLPIALNSTPGATSITASFGGDATHLTSSAEAGFSIAKASTELALAQFVTVDGEQRGAVATLKANLGTKKQPLQNRTVTVTVTGPVTKTLSLITDYLGQVRLPLDLPAGTYTIGITFAGDETYLTTSASGTSKVVTFAFQTPIDPAPTVNTAKAGSTVPVKFTIGGSFGLGILAGTPQTVKYSCETGVPTDEVEQTSTANSGLTFTNGVYQYNWKTAKNKTGCFRFELRLADGSLHVALIRLR